MGLHMFLHKTKRVDGFIKDDYLEIEYAVSKYGVPENRFYLPDENVVFDADMEKLSGIPRANELQDAVYIEGTDDKCFSIFKEIGFWHKVNAIHGWFVKHVGEGNCEWFEVSRGRLRRLLKTVNVILEKNSCMMEYHAHIYATRLLPTQSGFFFGSTEYDDGYYKKLELTRDILERVLAETDFEKEIVFYHASW